MQYELSDKAAKRAASEVRRQRRRLDEEIVRELTEDEARTAEESEDTGDWRKDLAEANAAIPQLNDEEFDRIEEMHNMNANNYGPTDLRNSQPVTVTGLLEDCPSIVVQTTPGITPEEEMRAINELESEVGKDYDFGDIADRVMEHRASKAYQEAAVNEYQAIEDAATDGVVHKSVASILGCKTPVLKSEGYERNVEVRNIKGSYRVDPDWRFANLSPTAVFNHTVEFLWHDASGAKGEFSAWMGVQEHAVQFGRALAHYKWGGWKIIDTPTPRDPSLLKGYAITNGVRRIFVGICRLGNQFLPEVWEERNGEWTKHKLGYRARTNAHRDWAKKFALNTPDMPVLGWTKYHFLVRLLLEGSVARTVDSWDEKSCDQVDDGYYRELWRLGGYHWREFPEIDPALERAWDMKQMAGDEPYPTFEEAPFPTDADMESYMMAIMEEEVMYS
jgi:hypothetical protein